MKILVPLLALVTVVAVGFVLVELHAPTSRADDAPMGPAPVAPAPPVAPPPPVSPAPAPVAAPPPVAGAPVAGPAAAPPPPADPLDVVVSGRTRREWHAYYAERQQKIAAEIATHQQIVDRAIRGEEPDPRELGEAHDKIRELNQRLKEDLEALQRIDASP